MTIIGLISAAISRAAFALSTHGIERKLREHGTYGVQDRDEVKRIVEKLPVIERHKVVWYALLLPVSLVFLLNACIILR